MTKRMEAAGRQSNLELLGIIAIFMIIVFHCSFKSGFSFEPGFSVNKLAVKAFWMLGELGVNLFMLISGYFMGAFKWKKLTRLLAEVQFYNWITLFAAVRLGAASMPTGKDLFLNFFPVTLNYWWFITAYLLVYILSPYLNVLIRAIDEKTFRKLLVSSLLLFSVIPTVFGFFFNGTEGMLYYNRFIWLVIMYLIGGYIRNYEHKSVFSRENAACLSVASAAVLVLSILVIDRFHGFFEKLGTTEPAYFWPPNTIPMVCLSVGLFVLFLRIELPYNPAINAAASTTLGVYLLHDGRLVGWLWGTVFRCAEYQNAPDLPFRILSAGVSVFAVCMAVDLLRQKLEQYTLLPLLDSAALHRAVQVVRARSINIWKGICTMNWKTVWNGKHGEAIQWGLCLLFPLSLAVLAFYQIIIPNYEEAWIVIATLVISALTGLYLIRKTGAETVAYVRRKPGLSVLCLCATLIVLAAIHIEKDVPLTDVVFQLSFLSFRPFRFRWLILAAPALFYLFLWAGRKTAAFLAELFGGMEEQDRRLYLGLTVGFSAVVLIAYAAIPGFFRQYDLVYSMDSGLCFSRFPQMAYEIESNMNICHPLISLITFPMWAVIHTVLGWFAPAQLLDTLCAACFQLVNVQMFLLCGFMLKELTESRWTLALWFSSFSVLTYVLFLEKYQYAVFFSVLFVWRLCRKEETALPFVIATGVMSTSGFLCTGEFLRKEPARDRLRRIGRTFLTGTAVLACAGRVRLLVPPVLLREISIPLHNYVQESKSIHDCVFAWINMTHNALFSLSADELEDWWGYGYMWTGTTSKVSILAIAALAVMLLGFLSRPRDTLLRACGLWVVFSVILFCVVKWDVWCTPLFSVCFVWAFVPLFQRGFQVLIERFRWNDRAAWGCVLIPMLAVNLVTLIDIAKYLSGFTF